MNMQKSSFSPSSWIRNTINNIDVGPWASLRTFKWHSSINFWSKYQHTVLHINRRFPQAKPWNAGMKSIAPRATLYFPKKLGRNNLMFGTKCGCFSRSLQNENDYNKTTAYGDQKNTKIRIYSYSTSQMWWRPPAPWGPCQSLARRSKSVGLPGVAYP